MQPNQSRKLLKTAVFNLKYSEMLAKLSLFYRYYPGGFCLNYSYGPIGTYPIAPGPTDTPKGPEQTGI